MTTPPELAKQAKEAADKATSGEWSATPEGDIVTEIGTAVGSWRTMVVDLVWCSNDAAFIAASRTLVPQLAAALGEACRLIRLAAVNGHCPCKAARAFLASDVSEASDGQEG